MHLMLHIFRKDFRRLWPAVLITLVLLGELTRLDCWRQDWLVTSAEGWLSLLLPLTWVCLIALLVQQEPLAGDRHFWITWPYRWQALLGSKVLFVLVFVHVPALLADVTILAYHGFHPAEYVSRLLWKQVLLAATVTVPAFGLATLFENLTTFLLAAIVIAGAAVYLSGAFEPLRAPWLQADQTRGGLATCILALSAGVIVLVQYIRRRTTSSRIAAASAMIFAGLMYGYLPPSAVARIRSALHPAAADISLGVLPPRPYLPGELRTLPPSARPDIVQVALPVTVSGISDKEDVRFNSLSAEIVAPASGAHRDFAVDAATFPYRRRPDWLFLQIRRSVMDNIKDSHVTIRAMFEVSLQRTGQTTWMRIGATQTVAGVGRCSTAIGESQNVYEGGMLKVLCESPNAIAFGTGVRLWQPETGREWRQLLGDAAPLTSGPREALLSPLNRLQTFFHLVSGTRDNRPGNGWLVPQEALANGKLAITPDAIVGWTTVELDVRDVSLHDYVLKAVR